MTSSANPQHEPTMEEILASIRKIISEDQPEAAKASAPVPAQPTPVRAAAAAPVTEVEADVLELTEEVEEDDEPVEPAPEPEPLIDNDIAFETIEPEPKAEPVMDQDDLISDSTRHAMGRAFAHLDRDMGFSAPPSGTLDALFLRAIQDAFVPTLKDWVDDHQPDIMDSLKPVIRAWLDEHLPPLIEAAVSREIARAAAERPRRR